METAVAVTALTRVPGWDSMPLRFGGLSLVLTGLFALSRPTGARLGGLMVFCGVSAFLGDLRYSSDPALHPDAALPTSLPFQRRADLPAFDAADLGLVNSAR